MLKCSSIIDKMKDVSDPLEVVPSPDIPMLEKKGAASIDLRLGTWIIELRRDRLSSVGRLDGNSLDQECIPTNEHYIRFGQDHLLHPGGFALGVTLEWIRMPATLGGYVVGKSLLGRHGLIIATAMGVHPGFCGCLTLELSNVGEVPIHLRPGMEICQLFLHSLELSSADTFAASSVFIGQRKPTVRPIVLDEIASKLAK